MSMRDRLQEDFGSSDFGPAIDGDGGGGGGGVSAWGWAHFWECRHLLGEFGRTH